MKKFSNPFFHSCEKRGRSIGEGNETSVEWNVVEAGSRSLLGAITAGLFYVKHPLSRGAHTDEPLTRTGQKHSRFRRRKWVAHMHTTVERERERPRRGAARRFRYRNFRLWQFAVQEVIRSTPTSPYDRIKLG